MIHYHGGPINPESCAVETWAGRHAFISFARPHQIEMIGAIAQTFACDNGAFTKWKEAAGKTINWDDYYPFIKRWMNHPGFDFAIIPDVIDGGEAENDALLKEWPHGKIVGVPVWHMNESDDRFIRLCNEYPRVAIGSCGEYDVKSPRKAVLRLKDIIRHVVDEYGQPICKLHGLRMLNPAIFTKLPLASADSTNVARNCKLDTKWEGPYEPATLQDRAYVLVRRIESHNSTVRLEYNEDAEKFTPQLSLEV